MNPALVRLQLAEAGYEGELALDELIARGTRALTRNGVFGDPRAATAEIGEAVLAAWTRSLVEEVAEAEERRLRPLTAGSKSTAARQVV